MFKKFDDWIRKTISEFSEKDGCSYYPGNSLHIVEAPFTTPIIISIVLVSHSGSNLHFKILFTEIRRHKIHPPFLECNAKFADSLQYLRQVMF